MKTIPIPPTRGDTNQVSGEITFDGLLPFKIVLNVEPLDTNSAVKKEFVLEGEFAEAFFMMLKAGKLNAFMNHAIKPHWHQMELVYERLLRNGELAALSSMICLDELYDEDPAMGVYHILKGGEEA